jgi:hypothetical protein
MNSLLKAINILHLHLNENVNTKITEASSFILSEKNTRLCSNFGINCVCGNNCVCTNNNYDFSTNHKNNRHICKYYNLQKYSNNCKACNNNNNYLINLRKIAYSKKNNTNKLCIYIRKKFDKISNLEKLYITETENYTKYKESLKSNPTIYYEAKKNLNNYKKRKRKIYSQIVLEKNKLINNRYNYIILFRIIEV